MSPFLKNVNFLLNNFIVGFFTFDSMIDSDLNSFPRLLASSSELFIPINTTSRILVSSSDVIHAFSIPTLGLKVDAFPGRINQLYTNPSRLGLFYGQCSEICGSNHSFMPIRFKVVSLFDFNFVSEEIALERMISLIDKEYVILKK